MSFGGRPGGEIIRVSGTAFDLEVGLGREWLLCGGHQLFAPPLFQAAVCLPLYGCPVGRPSFPADIGGLENKTRPHTLCLVVRQCATPSLSCARLSVASIPRCARQPVAFPHFGRYQNCFCLWGEVYLGLYDIMFPVVWHNIDMPRFKNKKRARSVDGFRCCSSFSAC